MSTARRTCLKMIRNPVFVQDDSLREYRSHSDTAKCVLRWAGSDPPNIPETDSQGLKIRSRYFLSMSLTRPRMGMVDAMP